MHGVLATNFYDTVHTSFIKDDLLFFTRTKHSEEQNILSNAEAAAAKEEKGVRRNNHQKVDPFSPKTIK